MAARGLWLRPSAIYDTISLPQSKQGEQSMNKKMSMKLLELSIKYSIIQEIVDSLKNNKGRWWTEAESKAEPPLWPTKESKIIFTSGKSNAIVDDGEGTLYFGDCGQFECRISDPELIELINAILPKTKKVAKKNYKNTTYMDVFKRVVDIMNDKTGYMPNEVKSEDEEIDICIDDDGDEHKTWSNVKAFVGGDPEESSIFEEVADLYAIYYKLANRWEAEFAKDCRILGKVNVKDTSPAGIMKALDEAGL